MVLGGNQRGVRDGRVEGKVALVAGAAGGIGGAGAAGLGRESAAVVCADINSAAAEVARPERAAYVAPKGGGRSLTHAKALDLASHAIRVIAIAPGPP
jgi:NAD(P)-dependent dehydrogenase (short-subunit alcohol dehydrogenase family)